MERSAKSKVGADPGLKSEVATAEPLRVMVGHSFKDGSVSTSPANSLSIKEVRHLAAHGRRECNDSGKMPPFLDRTTLEAVSLGSMRVYEPDDQCAQTIIKEHAIASRHRPSQ